MAHWEHDITISHTNASLSLVWGYLWEIWETFLRKAARYHSTQFSILSGKARKYLAMGFGSNRKLLWRSPE
jgi:hypothetical protein